MISVTEWASDEAETTVGYRGRTVEFAFRPGAYTGALVDEEPRLVDIVAACVTRWNIEGADPTNRDDLTKLPMGLITVIFRKIGQLSNQADPEGEDSAT